MPDAQWQPRYEKPTQYCVAFCSALQRLFGKAVTARAPEHFGFRLQRTLGILGDRQQPTDRIDAGLLQAFAHRSADLIRRALAPAASLGEALLESMLRY